MSYVDTAESNNSLVVTHPWLHFHLVNNLCCVCASFIKPAFIILCMEPFPSSFYKAYIKWLFLNYPRKTRTVNKTKQIETVFIFLYIIMQHIFKVSVSIWIESEHQNNIIFILLWKNTRHNNSVFLLDMFSKTWINSKDLKWHHLSCVNVLSSFSGGTGSSMNVPRTSSPLFWRLLSMKPTNAARKSLMYVFSVVLVLSRIKAYIFIHLLFIYSKCYILTVFIIAH